MDRVIGFLFFTLLHESSCLDYEMQPPEGESTPTLPFIGADPLYNGIIHIAICREEVLVGGVKRRDH